jgi:hypothetical protein
MEAGIRESGFGMAFVDFVHAAASCPISHVPSAQDLPDPLRNPAFPNPESRIPNPGP